MRKQIATSMEENLIKEMKKYCIDNDLTINTFLELATIKYMAQNDVQYVEMVNKYLIKEV